MLRSAASAFARQAHRSVSEIQDAAPSLSRSIVTYVPSVGDAKPKTITLIPGDGIGPEVSAAVEEVVDELGAPIVWERFPEVSGSTARGEPVDEVPEHVLNSIRKNKVCFKGTLFTPLSEHNTSTQSLNVQLRKALDLHVNLCHGFNTPGVPSRFENLDIVVIRENTEGEYSGLEHEVVPDVVESLKVVTREKSRRTAEYAFGFAFLNNRSKVTAVHKANIMKMSDGLFLEEFRKVAKSYPSIKAEEMIVDNTCMQLASHPSQFDVITCGNLYGNLIANILAGHTGGPGIMPGCNVGDGVAVFEQGARHVAADIAGKGVANPTAALLTTCMMLRHLNLFSQADRLQDAVLGALRDAPASSKTPDLGGKGTTATLVKEIKARLRG